MKNKWINHIYNIMSRRHNILPTRSRFFISSAGKLKACSNSKWNFSSSCFIAYDNHMKVARQHVTVFTEHDILHLWDNIHLLKYYPVKVPQNCFNSFNCSNKTGIQYSKFWFALDREKSISIIQSRFKSQLFGLHTFFAFFRK